MRHLLADSVWRDTLLGFQDGKLEEEYQVPP